ncbi:hypothetical protein LIER_28036 [Lithospermum erythrorhizon]|uniref:Uncharacterized protein n=1 Tax=Lithospermum erythrorhizon TaxID=34254 RepID=A0AAV3RK90_LITER
MTIDIEFNVNIAYSHFDLNQVTLRSKHRYLGAAGYSLDRDRNKYPATSLGKCERAVLFLLHHNVVPTTHESKVMYGVVYFVYRMFFGLNGLPSHVLAPILIQYMHRVHKHKNPQFVYHRWLTLVFQHFGVPLDSHLFQVPKKKVFNLSQL